MDTFPIELHAYILEFACTDDGTTARSISLVSSYFNKIVRQFLYQSIAVSGYDNIRTLETRLSAIPAHLRRTRNLYIADTSNTPDGAKLTTPHLTRLLALLSPTIESLSLQCANPRTSTVLISFLFGLHHPCLRELAVTGYYPFPHLPRAMPRLTHLHLNGNRNPHGLLMVGGLEAACPNLTHLRISGLQGARSFTKELAEAVEGSGEDEELFVAKLPPKVRHIYIQPGAAALVAKPTSVKPSPDDYMMETLHSLVNNHGVRCALVQSEEGAGAKADWINLLEGGDGCWATSRV